MRAEQSWSLLDPKPVLLYLSQHDEYIVYWNGIAMTHSQALCMAMESCCGIYATPEMKLALQKTFEKLYYANAFNTRAWDKRIENGSFVFESQKRWMQDHLNKHVKDKEAAEVLGWFSYSRARKEEHV
jgi:hypothetical protein